MPMSVRTTHLPFSPVSLATALVALLAVSYIGLIAVVMSYAALTVEFSQSVKTDEAMVATLEAEYLSSVSTLTNTDYQALGYAKPSSIAYVPSAPATALR